MSSSFLSSSSFLVTISFTFSSITFSAGVEEGVLCGDVMTSTYGSVATSSLLTIALFNFALSLPRNVLIFSAEHSLLKCVLVFLGGVISYLLQ